MAASSISISFISCCIWASCWAIWSMASAAFWLSPCCRRLLHLAHLLGHLLQLFHLLLLLLHLVELLLQLAGLGEVALALLLLDLLLEIVHRLLTGLRRRPRAFPSSARSCLASFSLSSLRRACRRASSLASFFDFLAAPSANRLASWPRRLFRRGRRRDSSCFGTAL